MSDTALIIIGCVIALPITYIICRKPKKHVKVYGFRGKNGKPIFLTKKELKKELKDTRKELEFWENELKINPKANANGDVERNIRDLTKLIKMFEEALNSKM